jgi:hypothetical protein
MYGAKVGGRNQVVVDVLSEPTGLTSIAPGEQTKAAHLSHPPPGSVLRVAGDGELPTPV